MIGVVPCIDSSVLLTESEAWQRQNQSNKSKSFTEAAAVATSNSSVLNNSRQIAINSPLCEKKSILNETVVPMESNNAAFSQGGMKLCICKVVFGQFIPLGTNCCFLEFGRIVTWGESPLGTNCRFTLKNTLGYCNVQYESFSKI